MSNLKSVFPLVSKPTRYINRELNTSHKDTANIRIRVALVFPDVYEIGMSHLGLHILYHILNLRQDVSAERAYAPWLDMEALLRHRNIPLCSLESSRPLAEFDLLGFTLPYEMCFTNVLNILDLAKIPLRAAERDEHFPLIIGGGASVHNPEPLAEFFDFFLLGDGEEAILEIVDTFAQWKTSGSDKPELLKALTKISGGYVPSLFEPRYLPSGEITTITPLQPDYAKVKRRIIADLDQAPYPIRPIVPYMSIPHDRINIEIARGCSRGCRFCQAGLNYRPVREKSPQVIEHLLNESIANSGYEEVSFSSLSTGDYSCWPRLLELMKKYETQNIAVSLPSLRPGTLSPEIIKQISRVRKTGFTIAPEAGTSRLRSFINKGITDQDIMDTVQAVFQAGWPVLKLYFMIGLPTEEEKDLQGIVALVKDISRWGKISGDNRPKRLNIGISCFVPKPHTALQWWPQEDIDSLRAKQKWLNKHLNRHPFQIKWQRPEVSYIEGLLARGDRKLSRLLLSAWQKGAKFDSWLEHFDLSRWEEALAECLINPDFYLTRFRGAEETFPWEHLNTRVNKAFLRSEYERALRGEATPDCREGKCSSCGVCDEEIQPVLKQHSEPLFTALSPKPQPAPTIHRHLLRAQFCKLGDLSFLSQLDLVRTLVRAMRRADIPVQYSQGFHPHPKISFGTALPVGIESTAEYMDIELSSALSPRDFTERLNHVLPTGLQVTEAKSIDTGFRSLAKISDLFAYQINLNLTGETKVPLFPESKEAQETHIQNFLSLKQIMIERSGKQIDIRPSIVKLVLVESDSALVQLEIILNSQLRPQEPIKKLFTMIPIQLFQMKRTGIWHQDGDLWRTPLEVDN